MGLDRQTRTDDLATMVDNRGDGGTACLVCGGPTDILDRVDFNRTCLGNHAPMFPPSGQMVAYRRCPACGFVFAPEFAAWSINDFLERIYNADYVRIDPEYPVLRPMNCANFLIRLFDSHRERIRHLDFGGGNGALSRSLSMLGWSSVCYDPMGEAEARQSPSGRFNLVTVIEVFEHHPDPAQLMKDLVHLVDSRFLILFSTVLSDGCITQGQPLDWWYAAPRNGHISLYSRKSLEDLGRKHGLTFSSFNSTLHLFYRDALPDWAGGLVVSSG